MAYNFMPVGIALEGKKCLIVGGGVVALRKINNLLQYGCEITVIAPETIDQVDYFASKKIIKLEKRKYESPEAKNYAVVIAASDDYDVNKQISNDCREANIPINAVDMPELCDFIFPAIVRRNNLSLAISTDGHAPFLAGHLKVIMENIFPEKRWNKIADLAAEFRQMVQAKWHDNQEQKNAAFARFLETDWQRIFEEGGEKQDFQPLLEEMLQA